MTIRVTEKSCAMDLKMAAAAGLRLFNHLAILDAQPLARDPEARNTEALNPKARGPKALNPKACEPWAGRRLVQ
jgi:hypothetical protein